MQECLLKRKKVAYATFFATGGRGCGGVNRGCGECAAGDSAASGVTGVSVLSSPTRSLNAWLPWKSCVDAMLICSHAALCSSVDALTCIAAVA